MTTLGGAAVAGRVLLGREFADGLFQFAALPVPLLLAVPVFAPFLLQLLFKGRQRCGPLVELLLPLLEPVLQFAALLVEPVLPLLQTGGQLPHLVELPADALADELVVVGQAAPPLPERPRQFRWFEMAGESGPDLFHRQPQLERLALAADDFRLQRFQGCFALVQSGAATRELVVQLLVLGGSCLVLFGLAFLVFELLTAHGQCQFLEMEFLLLPGTLLVQLVPLGVQCCLRGSDLSGLVVQSRGLFGESLSLLLQLAFTFLLRLVVACAFVGQLGFLTLQPRFAAIEFPLPGAESVPELVGLLLQACLGGGLVDARGGQGQLERRQRGGRRARSHPGRRVPGRTRAAGVGRTRSGRAGDVEIGSRHDRGNRCGLGRVSPTVTIGKIGAAA